MIFERAPRHYAAYMPDLPSATGNTPEETERRIRDAMAFHLEGMRREHLPIPEAPTWTETVEV